MTDGRALDADQRRLLHALRRHCPADPAESAHRDRVARAVRTDPLWWHRDTLPGHVTGSAFVTDPDCTRVLLHRHRRLERWMQFGGHDDGARDPAATAARELAEESGLRRARPFGEAVIFDVDVHAIPARAGMPAHDHLDVRYLFVADPAERPAPADGESVALEWFALADAPGRREEPGLSRALTKIELLGAEIRSR